MFLNPGDTVEGRYRVERTLGGGGYATVYLATNVRLNKAVALKVLRVSGPTPDAHAKLLARFEGEAQIAAQITHRCSVEVSDYGTLPSGQPFLIMEHIDGPTLAEALEVEGAMVAERVKALWLDTLEALAEAHAKGVVHRDLKPDNLMLADIGTRRERLVILDFGIARRTHEADRKHSTTRGYLGTPSYMPPELLGQASSATAATDVFQVGLIMSEMLTGTRRIQAESLLGMADVYRGDGWSLPDALIQGPFGVLLDRALRLDAAERFPDARALMEALDAIELAPSPTPRAPDDDQAPSQGRVPTILEEEPRDADAQANDAEATRAAKTEASEEASGDTESTIIVEPKAEAPTPEVGRSGEVQHTQREGRAQATHQGTQAAPSTAQGKQAWWVAGVLAVVCVGLVWALLSRQEVGGNAAVVRDEPEERPSERSGAGGGTEGEEGERAKARKTAKSTSEDDEATAGGSASEQSGEATVKQTREGMVYVEEGNFIRGSDEGDGDEKPASRVWLDGFWIDTYEATVGEYAACVKAGKCTVPVKTEAISKYYNWGVSGPRRERMKHPINGVDWSQAATYCGWKGKRLPTEAQWEKAARGVDGRKYPWGLAKASCEYAVMDDGCGKDRTWEVGSKPRGISPYGVHDMAGNVWEWTADWYDENYYASRAGRGRNPMGPRSGSERVMRGGSVVGYGGDMRASDRYRGAPSVAAVDLGFRCSGSTE